MVVGAGAAVLGPFTVGRGARIGSNAVVLKEVPAGSTVVGVPAHGVTPRRAAAGAKACFPAYGTDPDTMIDPVYRSLESLNARVAELEQQLAADRERRPVNDEATDERVCKLRSAGGSGC